MNAIEWTATAITRCKFIPPAEDTWTARVRSLLTTHGQITAGMLAEAYGLSMHNARRHIRRQSRILGLRVLRQERRSGKGWAITIWGKR